MLGRFKTLAASIRTKQDIIFTSKTRWAIDNYAGMRIRIRIRSDPVIFGPPDPDLVLFSTDPDPTCNNGFIKLFLS